MFCYQCEQTAKGTGCTVQGVCGKLPEIAALQDLLLYSLMGLSQVAVEGRKVGVSDSDVNVFTVKAAFSTLTNVDFDPDRFVDLIQQSIRLREKLKTQVEAAGGNNGWLDGSAVFQAKTGLEELVKQGEQVGIKSYPGDNPDILSLKHTVLYGIKGVSAYTDHALILGQEDESVYAYVHEGLAAIQGDDLGVEDWIQMALRCGEAAYKAMELLDAGNTEKFGHPVPTKVPLGYKKGKAILVSGHDMNDLEALLKQTEGKGINIYSHGEMLSTHGYPKLKAYPHFYGQFGTAWQKQTKEFSDFPGAILMTTNCIQRPKNDYKENLFTSGMVGWPGIPHIPDLNFQPVIDRALELRGFEEDHVTQEVTVGFARNAVLGVADKVIEAVKSGDIKHFFLVAGCDGAKPGRNYYTEFVEKVPKNCIVLTLACGKYRFFDQNLGDIGGIPRLLDAGQCNDAYSAVQIALALSNAFGVGVNELPLSMIISWYEQKAVCVLLALLHLGIKDIRLGPSLPAFITPNVLQTLVDNFEIKPITSAEEDLKAILG
ncbi:MAG: hydroxylamine reductase [Desulfobacteraceae bacterium]|jgi:hydroxylamine reductase|nr:hydroxylamine reductase [Desulfobacteraceae bacterium]